MEPHFRRDYTGTLSWMSSTWLGLQVGMRYWSSVEPMSDETVSNCERMIFWSFWAPALFILTDLVASTLFSTLDKVLGKYYHPEEPQYFTRTITHVFEDLWRAFKAPWNQFWIWAALFFLTLQELALFVGPNLRTWNEAYLV